LVDVTTLLVEDHLPALESSTWRHSALRLVDIYLSRQFASFVLFGGLAALVNLAVGSAIYGTRIEAFIPYFLAVAIGAASGLFVNFTLNYRYNFRYRGRSAVRQLTTFCIVAAIGVVLTSMISALAQRALVTFAARHFTLPLLGNLSAEFASHVFAVGVVTFYSFAAHRAFSFNSGIRSRFRSALAKRVRMT
jgi:putative flippase GtrA